MHGKPRAAVAATRLRRLSAPAVGASSDQPPPVIKKEAYVLCGLTISDSEAKAQKVLGKPGSLHQGRSEMTGGKFVEMKWEGIEGSFLDSELVNLTVTSPRCGNPNGLVVGDSVDRTFALLGVAQAAHPGARKSPSGRWVYSRRDRQAACYDGHTAWGTPRGSRLVARPPSHPWTLWTPQAGGTNSSRWAGARLAAATLDYLLNEQ